MSDELAAALGEFAKRRTGALARTIDELGRAAVKELDPELPRKNFEFHRAWLELARDAPTRTWCLDTILDKLPKLMDGVEHRAGDKYEALIERLQALRDVEPDPRVGRAMLGLLELRSPVARVVIDEIARVLVRHADDEARASPAISELPDFDVDLLPKSATPIAAKPMRRDLAELYAAVYASPDDDAPRAVLADALQDAGDPRGELIALQLREAAGDATDEMRERARVLVQKHGKPWLGALRPITYRAELRRGFLARLELAGKWSSSKWTELAHEPSIATVEELVPGQAKGNVIAQLLPGVLGRAVRSLEVDDDPLWATIVDTSLPRLRELRVFTWKRDKYDQRFLESVVPYLEAHPAITRVGCRLEMVPRLPKPVAARLEMLTIRCEVARVAKLWATMPKLRRLRCERYDDVELVREGKRELVRVYASTWGTRIDLKGLPRSITRVEVYGNKTSARELAARNKRLDVVMMPTPSGVITGVK